MSGMIKVRFEVALFQATMHQQINRRQHEQDNH